MILFFASYCFGPTSRAHCIRMRFKGKQDEFFYKKRETGHVETGQPTKPNPTRISSNSHKNEMCRRYKAAFHNFVITIHTLIHTRKKKKSVVLRRIKKKKIFTPPRTNKDQQVFTKDDGRGLKLWWGEENKNRAACITLLLLLINIKSVGVTHRGSLFSIFNA